MEHKQMLVCVSGPLKGRKFSLNKEIFRIGASLDNDLVIADDDYVSGAHAVLRCEGDSLVIADQHSRNGTFVDNHRVNGSSLVLGPGNRISVGKSLFKVASVPGQPRITPAHDTSTRWDKALAELEDLYKDVERRSLSLPAFSLLPVVIVIWSIIKFEFFLLLDILLLPLNTAIFLRNLFPGKWHYCAFSSSYWRYAITWLWRGEVPFYPIGVIRPLVRFLVMGHIHNRIESLKRYVFLDDNISNEDRARLESKILGLQERWKTPSAPQVVYNFVLPASGPLAAVYKFLISDDSGVWLIYPALLLISYSIAFVVTGLMVKRALMLGASGRALYFPGAVAGTQCYGKEREIFNSLGIPSKEFPFDVAVNFVSIVTGMLLTHPWWALSLPFRLPMLPTEDEIIGSIAALVAGVLINGLALYRRKVTHRL
jgi:hypothetical protein